jgi:hypothetical protein
VSPVEQNHMVHILHKFVFIQMFEVFIVDVNMLVRAVFRLFSYDICKMVVTNTEWDDPPSIVIIIIGDIHMIYSLIPSGVTPAAL